MLGYFGRGVFILTPKSEWDVPDILTLLFTLVIALYLQHHVIARSEKDKARREYLIELASTLRNAAAELHALVRNGHAESSGVITAIRNLNAALADLADALKLCESKCAPVLVDAELRRYRDLIGDYPAEPLTANQLQHIEKTFAAVRKAISRLILEVHSN